MPINSAKIKKIVQGSKEVFTICQIKNKLGTVFYASDPKTRYPWIYTRDLSTIIKGFSELNDLKTAKNCCQFLLNIQAQDGQWFQKYDSSGQRQDIEKDKPIVQEDNTPLALWALLSYIQISKDEKFKNENKNKIEKSLHWIINYQQKSLKKLGLVYSTTSIHQTPGYNQGYELWHNSLAAKVFELAFDIYKNKSYQKTNQILKENIAKKLVVNGRFIRKLNDKEEPDLAPDIIMASPAYFDIFSKNELIKADLIYFKVLKNTLFFLEENLFDKEMGGFFRYPNEITKKWFPENNWSIEDPLVPGPYLVATSFMIQLYYKLKEKKKAQDLLNWLIEQDVKGKLPEHLTSDERFFTYRRKEWNYMIKRKKDKNYLKGVKKNFKQLEKEAKKSKKLHYVLPLVWAQMEALRCLKQGGYIDKFIL